jgi:hypothetical protein
MNCRADAVSEVVDYGTFGSSTLIMPKPRQIAMLSVHFDADRAVVSRTDLVACAWPLIHSKQGLNVAGSCVRR